MLHQGVFVLNVDIAAANLDRIELVTADAALEDLLAAALRVEVPLAGDLYERHREGPVVITYIEGHAARMAGIADQTLLRARLGRELRRHLLIASRLAGVDDVVTARA